MDTGSVWIWPVIWQKFKKGQNNFKKKRSKTLKSWNNTLCLEKKNQPFA